MQSNNLRPLRLAALAVALTACASESVNAPSPSVEPRADGGTVSATGGVVISQVYGGGGNSGAPLKNDYIELYNAGTTDVTVDGWSVQYTSATGPSGTGAWFVTPLSGTILSGHYYLVQEAAGSNANATPLPTPDATGTIAMSSSSGKVALVNTATALSGVCPTGASIIDFVGFGSSANCYEGTGPTATISNTSAALRANNGATDTNDNHNDFATGTPNPRNSGGTSGGGGGGGGGGNPGGGSGSISVSGSAIPVGFQTQLFVNSGSKDKSGNTVGSSDVTWSSNNTSVITVDASTGVVTAVSQGSATITATAKSDGTTGTTTVSAYVATVSPTARVGHNVDEGTPTDADPSDDVIIARRQYTLSYNVAHGGPNWVSWNLDATHTGSASRCNCFTADTALTRLGIKAYDTNDWINGGIWSRGHMSPSADWADADGDNAPTFFLSNMIPQNQTANAGAWGSLENALRDTAATGAEIYIVAGPIFTKNRSGAGVDGFGFMNSKGHIAVPDSMFKIALIIHSTRTPGSIDSTSEINVIAVNMPNESSAVGSWTNFTTTVNAIQRSTGYDFLSALPDSIEKIVEANDHAPVPALTTSTPTVGVGQTASVSGTFTDPDGRGDAPWLMTFAWGDGTTSTTNSLLYLNGTTKISKTHAYASSGTYTVRLTVKDKYGAAASTDVTITVQ